MRSGGAGGADRSTGSLAENQREPERRLSSGRRRFQGSGRRMLGSFFTLSPTEAEATPAFNYLRVSFLFAICVIAYQLTTSFWLFVTLWAWFLVPIRHAERVSALEKRTKGLRRNGSRQRP